MAPLIPQTARKSETETAADRARNGQASFARSMASLPKSAPASQPARRAFLSGIGGTSDAPTVAPVATVKKSSVLDALPPAIVSTVKAYDPGIQKFVATIYERHAATGEYVSFTASDAGAVMGLPTDKARKAVDALAANGVIRAHYSMGALVGYVPAVAA
jgi:hypothetical protein